MSAPVLKRNRKNTRLLAVIASTIHNLTRRDIFSLGELLAEAREECEHGAWGPWLKTEFEWSADTAKNYMRAAKLARKFRTVRNLKLAASTIYLAATADESDWSALVAALRTAATKTQISAKRGREIIESVLGKEDQDNELPPSSPNPSPGLAALIVILKCVESEEQIDVGDHLSPIDLRMIADFVTTLASTIREDDPVKLVADRAEASARARALKAA